ncbi:hypothetical protein DPMN_159062 [Dreissena polymorpha]|uniref:Uncharacterized protein n=1 Tax=Dreissena polymorpha TaxID=45954 RepID=A0A9D4IMJ7_DREPO|nr:hypothetical protein DPMN_159062 [Dreissena polymorpha]
MLQCRKTPRYTGKLVLLLCKLLVFLYSLYNATSGQYTRRTIANVKDTRSNITSIISRGQNQGVQSTWTNQQPTLFLRRSEVCVKTNDKRDDIIVTPYNDTRENLIYKVRYAMIHEYMYLMDSFHCVLKADDDTYVIMENLRFFC